MPPTEEPDALPDDPVAEVDQRIAEAVERFLLQVRGGGSLDPETVLRESEAVREELEPLLRAVLRLEEIARHL